ncbi:MAG TPA: DinB family protein [Bryobacteraceae bacterium]|nr:DinB family protein [Bryobacteraceae bacterium]
MEESVLASFSGRTILETTPAVIGNMIAGATPEQLAWRPDGDRWSIEMVLAHLADVEINGFLSRFHALTGEDDPLLPIYDQHALFGAVHDFDARRDLVAFQRAREQTLEVLRALPTSAMDRRGRHEELRSRISFGELLHELAFHDLGHIRQIAELYRSAAFYPNMGAFRSYYRINP